MKTEIITVGNELLTGKTLDTNNYEISKFLNSIGATVDYVTIVGDVYEKLKSIFTTALNRSDIIIMTGGLGPTDDDITKEVVCGVLKKPLVFNKNILNKIRLHFKKRNLEMPEINKKQAYIPAGCCIMYNKYGTAPGFIIKNAKKWIILLPGVPSEMRPMLYNDVQRLLKRLIKQKVFKVTIKTAGIPESELYERISDIHNEALKENIEISYTAHPFCVDLTLTAQNKEKLKKYETKIKDLLKENVFNSDSLEEEIGKLLKRTNSTVAIAESCTGGLVSKKITDIPGASQYFIEAIIAYSNETKIRLLNVEPEILKKYGAVSEKVAEQMAIGIRKIANTTYGISITGIAGPSGGTPKKPVGFVYIGIATPEKVITEQYNFVGNRERIRELAASACLNLLRKQLLQLD